MKRIHIRFARCIVASVTALACVGLFPPRSRRCRRRRRRRTIRPTIRRTVGCEHTRRTSHTRGTPRLVRGHPRPGHPRDARGHPGLVGRRSPDARPGAARTG